MSIDYYRMLENPVYAALLCIAADKVIAESDRYKARHALAQYDFFDNRGIKVRFKCTYTNHHN